jgi:hypothetical protein
MTETLKKPSEHGTMRMAVTPRRCFSPAERRLSESLWRPGPNPLQLCLQPSLYGYDSKSFFLE